MYTNCNGGDFKQFLKEMIEFSLQVDARIVEAVLPELGRIFVIARKESACSFVCPNPLDDDLVEAWESGLAEEAREDRGAVARLLKDPGFASGRVEVKEEDAEDLLRGLTELRLTLRSNSLSALSDHELETGDLALEEKDSSLRLGFFAYLVIAEVQERLIEFLS
jgi:hypothetical protein